jgi:nucleotide-binding universal stress UspA family protein
MTANKQKLLVCVSNNQHSIIAIKFACQKAKKSDFIIELVTVIDTSSKGPEGIFSVSGIFQKEKRQEAEDLLNKYGKKVKDWSDKTPILSVREGYVAEEIKTAIEEDKTISMIILGASPESTSKGKLIPYLAEQLSSKLFIPLMIVPDNLTDAQIEKLA